MWSKIKSTFPDIFGFKYITSQHTDGGGLRHAHWIIKAIQMMCPNKKWTRALDFGCGDGILGMALLAHKLVDEVVFVDHYAPAVENCKQNLKNNNIMADVICHKGVNNLEAGPFDLVLSNPPHHRICELEKAYNINWLPKQSEPVQYAEAITKFNLNHPHRHFDEQWETHKEFYKYVKKILFPNADIFMFENAQTSNPLQWEWGRLKDIEPIQWVDKNQISELEHHYVLHLIAKIPTNK